MQAPIGFCRNLIFNSSIIDELKPLKNQTKNSLFGFLIKNAFEKNKRIFSYNTSEYIRDMGTEKRYLEVSEAIKTDLLNKKNYTNSQKALFLDRDNTLVNVILELYFM